MHEPRHALVLLNSITLGTLLGFFLPGVLCVIVGLIGNWPSGKDLLDMVLIFGVPSLCCALVGGVSAHFSNNAALWPIWLLTAIVLGICIVSCSLLVGQSRDVGPVFGIAIIGLNVWFAGWFAILIVRETRVEMEAPPENPAGHQDRFVPASPTDGEASPHIRGNSNEIRESPPVHQKMEDDAR